MAQQSRLSFSPTTGASLLLALLISSLTYVSPVTAVPYELGHSHGHGQHLHRRVALSTGISVPLSTGVSAPLSTSTPQDKLQMPQNKNHGYGSQGKQSDGFDELMNMHHPGPNDSHAIHGSGHQGQGQGPPPPPPQDQDQSSDSSDDEDQDQSQSSGDNYSGSSNGQGQSSSSSPSSPSYGQGSSSSSGSQDGQGQGSSTGAQGQGSSGSSASNNGGSAPSYGQGQGSSGSGSSSANGGSAPSYGQGQGSSSGSQGQGSSGSGSSSSNNGGSAPSYGQGQGSSSSGSQGGQPQGSSGSAPSYGQGQGSSSSGSQGQGSSSGSQGGQAQGSSSNGGSAPSYGQGSGSGASGSSPGSSNGGSAPSNGQGSGSSGSGPSGSGSYGSGSSGSGSSGPGSSGPGSSGPGSSGPGSSGSGSSGPGGFGSTNSTGTRNGTASATSGQVSPTSTPYCKNSPSHRNCWGDGYDIDTNYYNEVPETGVTREFWLELLNVTASPDGVEMQVLTVNGTIPGPTLIVDWGDTVVVHVTNSLANNGSTIHWHGIRQLYNNGNDGVPSIVQCPIAPGSTYTYTWKAEQYGTTWYHSHFELQAWDGVFGGIIINGPATANYDVDLGTVILNDWSHQSMTSLFSTAESRGPPELDTALINGTMVWEGAGSYFETTIESGKIHRLRFINAAVDTTFKFSVDEHNLTVIAADLVPIIPYDTETVTIGNGQRYDVLIDATESTGDFWLRAIPQTSCSDNGNTDNILGIVRYDSNSTSNPNSTAFTFLDSCLDDNDLLVPWLELDVGDDSLEQELDVVNSQVAARKTKRQGFGGGGTPSGTGGPGGFGGNTIFKWTLNAVSMEVEWEEPTLLSVYNNDTSFTNQSAVYELPDADVYIYVVIETTMTVDHPIHLHGHDFWILASGTGTYTSNTTLTTSNPPRRDTAMLPGGGYLVLAFYTDNPGAWLMHCHIGWHTAEGFAIQWLERVDEIRPLIDYDTLEQTCSSWEAYATSANVTSEDSGV